MTHRRNVAKMKITYRVNAPLTFGILSQDWPRIANQGASMARKLI